MADTDTDTTRTRPVFCATCGARLDGDPDEDPTGDTGLPICGECARARDFEALDLGVGVLDDVTSQT